MWDAPPEASQISDALREALAGFFLERSSLVYLIRQREQVRYRWHLGFPGSIYEVPWTLGTQHALASPRRSQSSPERNKGTEKHDYSGEAWVVTDVRTRLSKNLDNLVRPRGRSTSSPPHPGIAGTGTTRRRGRAIAATTNASHIAEKLTPATPMASG